VLPFAQKAEKGVHTLSRALNSLGLIALLLMTFVVAFDVLGRYLLKRPIPGSPDIIEIIMLIMVYSAFAYCAYVDGNVRVDVLYSKFPKLIQTYLDIVTSILSVLIVGLISWQMGAYAWYIYLNPPGPVTGYFQWSLLPFFAFAAVGTGLLCLELLIWFFHSLNRTRSF